MTNREIALGWLRQAENILEEAKTNFDRKLWHLVVRRSQESVEMALKSLLGYGGIEVPKIHDVGFLVAKNRNRFSSEIQKECEHLQSISRSLKKERETSFYGDEELQLPPEELYHQRDAEHALAEARFLFQLVKTEMGKPTPNASQDPN
jgi:HEPN domain-containing protein